MAFPHHASSRARATSRRVTRGDVPALFLTEKPMWLAEAKCAGCCFQVVHAFPCSVDADEAV